MFARLWRFIVDKALNVLIGVLPTIHSISEESNILGVYDDSFILTTNENLVGIVRLEGMSYSNMDAQDLEEHFSNRQLALDGLENFVVRLYTKRREYILNGAIDTPNEYAKAIMERFERKSIFENHYYIVLETTNKAQGILEHHRERLITEDKTSKSVYNHKLLHHKAIKLREAIHKVEFALQAYKPSVLSALKVLEFYAELINGVDIALNVYGGFLSDSYVAGDVLFKKDYFTHQVQGQTLYKRLIGVKAYESDTITSMVIDALLHQEIPMDIVFSLEPLSTHKAFSFLQERARFSMSNLVKERLAQYQELVKIKRLSMQKCALNVLIQAPSKEALDTRTQIVLNTLSQGGIVGVVETLGLRVGYFSLFPERIYLNHRLRYQTSKALACLMVFEKQFMGFKANSWGDKPLSVFKHLDASPYLFNFHNQAVRYKNNEDVPKVNGHTMVIGATGSGKTTLMAFLMASALKYPQLKILAFDRLQGLYSFARYCNANYHNKKDCGINPLTLPDTVLNREFLQSFYQIMMGVDSMQVSECHNIATTLSSLYNTLKPETFNLLDFKNALYKMPNKHFSLALEPYINNPLFNAMHDSVDFSCALNVINLDGLSQNAKDLGLLAYYIFYKMMDYARENKGGFLLFLDEFKSYIENDALNSHIYTLITQARKANGVVVLALQDIHQLQGVKNAQSFVRNMGTLIFYPQKNIDTKSLQEYFGVRLSDSERFFLENTPSFARQILVKNMGSGISNIVDVDLSSLGELVSVFNSNTSWVQKVQRLEKEYPNDWRQRLLL
nr:type IV secretion ATPase [Helicobacter delphinicola]